MPGNEPSPTAASGDGGGNQSTDVPIDWEALEDAFENNAPEVHSYLHVPTGDVLRIVDGIADPQMHARIAADKSYLRIEPVSSREQYRWMERYIPMVDSHELQERLTRAIDGKGAFRRFKDVLMSHGAERERWFAFRSERLRIFMEAWLNAHALNPVKRPVWVPDASPDRPSQAKRETGGRRGRGAEALRKRLRELSEGLGARDLDHLLAFGEFLRARRASGRRATPSQAGAAPPAPQEAPSAPSAGDSSPPSGQVPTDPGRKAAGRG